MTIVPLPCPFCGKQPKLHPRDPKTEGNAWGMVRCENIRCVTEGSDGFGVRVKDGALSCDERGSAKYIEAAIRRWNRRKT